MTKYTNILLSIVLILLLINIALTGAVLIKQTPPLSTSTQSVKSSLKLKIANEWGQKVSKMYNQQDHNALYAIFNEQAKLKISHQQLQTQLSNLFQLFGAIEERSIVSADKVANKGSTEFYKLVFNIRVSKNNTQAATMTLSVVVNNGAITLYGIRINANQSLD